MDQMDRYDPETFDFLGPPFAVPVGGDLLLTIPQEDAVTAALNALGRDTAVVLITGDSGSGRTLVADALADALRGRGLVVDQIVQLGGIGGLALLGRLAPLLRIAPERSAPVLAAFAAGSAGQAAPDPVSAVPPSPAVTGRRSPPAREAHAPDAVMPGRRGTAWDGLGRARPEGLATPGVVDPGRSGVDGEVLRAVAQAGAGLAAEARPARALAVIVDDAQAWPTETLLLLVSLARLRVRDAPLLQAVMIGDAALERRLAAMPGTGPDATRGGRAGDPAGQVSLRIPPLTLRQGQEYLAQRFADAGGSLERTMSAAAVAEILLRCGGNPARIDQLADDCLALTARRRWRRVTAAVVRAAREPPRRRRPLLSSPVMCALLGATGGALVAGAGLTLALRDWTAATSLEQRAADTRPPAGGTAAGSDATLFAGTGRFGTPAPDATLLASRADKSAADAGAARLPAAPPATPSALASRTGTAPVADARPGAAREPGQPEPQAGPAGAATTPGPALDTMPVSAPEEPVLAARSPVPASPPVPPVRIDLAAIPAVPAPDATTLPVFPDAPRIATMAPAVPPAPALLATPILLPQDLLSPVPAAPVLAAPGAPPRLAAPLLASAAPAVIQAPGRLGIPELVPPVLALPADGPAAQPAIAEPPAASNARIAAAEPRAEVSESRDPVVAPPVLRDLPAVLVPAGRTPRAAVPEALPPHYDGAVVMHEARGHDTASVLLRRIWGQDNAPAQALFRSLNPSIDPHGPWPDRTAIAVPQRVLRKPASRLASLHPRDLQAPPLAPPPAPRAVRDAAYNNPTGVVSSPVPYFCTSILPQNSAEDAYVRQACGRKP